MTRTQIRICSASSVAATLARSDPRPGLVHLPAAISDGLLLRGASKLVSSAARVAHWRLAARDSSGDIAFGSYRPCERVRHCLTDRMQRARSTLAHLPANLARSYRRRHDGPPRTRAAV